MRGAILLVAVFSSCRAEGTGAMDAISSAASIFKTGPTLRGLDVVMVEGTRVPYNDWNVQGSHSGADAPVAGTGRCAQSHTVGAINQGTKAATTALIADVRGQPRNVTIKTSPGFSIRGAWEMVARDDVPAFLKTAPEAWPAAELNALHTVGKEGILWVPARDLPPGAWVEVQYEYGVIGPCSPEGNR